MVTKQVVNQGTMSGQAVIAPHITEFNQYGGIGLRATARPTLGCVIGQLGNKNQAGGTDYFTLTVDMDSPHFSCGAVKIPFLGHGLAFNPSHAGRAAVFEKRGQGACEIDLQTGRMLRAIPTAEERQFYGHGAYSPDGKVLYAAETLTHGSYKGVIMMRDAETLEEIGEFPSYGARPHDCQILADGKTMIITNGGGLVTEQEQGSITYVDIATHKLIHKLTIDNKQFNAGHVAVADNGDIAVVSAPREGMNSKRNGGVTIGGIDRDLKTATGPSNILNKMRGETLSVCIDDNHRTAAATTPDAGRITFWDLDTGELKHTIKVTHPRGVTLTQDKKHFIFSYDRPASKIGLVAVDTLAPVAGYDVDIAYTGSHIVAHSY